MGSSRIPKPNGCGSPGLFGPDYVRILVLPEVGAHARQQLALWEPEEIYTTQRAAIQSAILEKVQHEMTVKYLPEEARESFVHFEDVFIRSITLPDRVREAIKNKLAQRHVMLEWDYRLQREEKERDRKMIEAQGIHMFQSIVSEGISEKYLKWRGIDATLELARSNNSKIVVIGAGEDGFADHSRRARFAGRSRGRGDRWCGRCPGRSRRDDLRAIDDSLFAASSSASPSLPVDRRALGRSGREAPVMPGAIRSFAVSRLELIRGRASAGGGSVGPPHDSGVASLV